MFSSKCLRISNAYKISMITNETQRDGNSVETNISISESSCEGRLGAEDLQISAQITEQSFLLQRSEHMSKLINVTIKLYRSKY